MTALPLGARLREARQRRGLSLRELARRVGVSASLLSQVENGKSQVSVTNLHALVTALDVSLDQLFDAGPAPSEGPAGPAAHHGVAALGDGPVHRVGERPILEMASGVTWERLASLLGDLVDTQLVTYQPGSSSSSDGRLTRHNGTEFAYLIEGELVLILGYEEYVLTAGESLAFDSTMPHLYANRSSAVARGVWFEVGRRVAGGLDRDWAELAVAARPTRSGP
jgi:transcriptional regulator with XRE-family HTH domain